MFVVALAWQDHAVIVVYLAMMVALGAYLSRRQRTDEEYFLAGRRMPWAVVGVSIIASLLSSITYLAEPGEVWKSGATHMWGKMLAIPAEMAVVWLVCIPFFMRFRYTSAYEYMGDRFGVVGRRAGIALFVMMVVAWMGIVVLVSSRALADVTGVPLYVVIGTVGIVATGYTVLGGLRAVIWTDLAQVILLCGGAVFAILYVAYVTESGPTTWYHTVASDTSMQRLPWFSASPFERATLVTVAVHMFVWHVCTHTANQMTVQRYFSTSGVTAARRSFVVGSLLGVVINLLLLMLGLAIFYYYQMWPERLPESIDPSIGKAADRVFPNFVVSQLPPGIAGGILAALLAAAMSSIDSGVNSLATVLSVELEQSRQDRAVWKKLDRGDAAGASHVSRARLMTVVIGVVVTGAAIALDSITGESNIVEMLPRSFNCFTGAMGGLFLVGMFLPRASWRSAVAAAACGLAMSFCLAYGQELFGLERPFSFTWVMPGSLATCMFTAYVFSRFEPAGVVGEPGLTWATKDEIRRPDGGAST